jgi:hypothetical protein
MNGTHPLLAYADDVILLTDNMNTIHNNTDILTDASKEAGLEINAKKTNYKQTNKQTPWHLFRKRTIPTERPPLVRKI